MAKIETIKLQGKDYAQVKDRVKEFRSDNPRGKIETTPMIQPDGSIIFKAYVLKDKEDSASAESTAHSYSKELGGKEKNFEKLETIAVGRALALLGYSSDGEIASSEEMEEFQKHKVEKFKEQILETVDAINNCETIDDLQSVWSPLSPQLKKELEKVKNNRKNILLEVNKVNESN